MTRGAVGVRAAAATLLAGLVLATGVGTGSAAAATPAGGNAVDRVLVLVVPGLAWRDFDDLDLPHLRRLTDEAALANLSIRAPKFRTDLTGAYLTLGAGNKARGVGPVDDGTGLEPDGAALEVDEQVGSDGAGAVFRRRTGHSTTGGIVHLGVPETVAANESSVFSAKVGAFGGALGDAGIDRAVIANGDGSDATGGVTVPTRYRRDAAGALMDRHGTVPTGRVSDVLLRRDPSAPFGVRLDADRVAREFRQVWHGRAVVLVEASDLVRAERYRPAVDSGRGDALRREALVAADRLAGRLLQSVDGTREAVVLLGTTPTRTDAALGVVAIRAPATAPGLLRSGTTQRAGFVQLMDVSPSVLDLVGVARPESMRGRPVHVADESGTAASRRELLVDVDAASRFRAEIVNPVAMAIIALECALIVLAVLALARAWGGRARARIATLAAVTLGTVPAVYLARLLPLHDTGLAPYWLFVVATAVAIGVVARAVARGDPLVTALVALAVVAGVLIADGLLGGHLQLNSALGYSAEVAGRFIGYGNAGYAALAAAALWGAGLLAHRIGGRAGAWAGVGVLAVALIVDGAPFWGADVGGVLSMVPAYAVTAVLLLGWRLRVRTAVFVTLGTLGAIALAAFVDFQRAPGERTHLGRLVEQIGDEGVGAFTTVVQRKLDMNIASLSSSVWRLLIPVAFAFVAYLTFAGARPLPALLRRIPELRATLVGFAVLLVLGYGLNDTGVLVPAVMLGILVPVLVLLVIPVAANERVLSAASVDGPDP